jgi:hypothetical protein
MPDGVYDIITGSHVFGKVAGKIICSRSRIRGKSEGRITGIVYLKREFSA